MGDVSGRVSALVYLGEQEGQPPADKQWLLQGTPGGGIYSSSDLVADPDNSEGWTNLTPRLSHTAVSARKQPTRIRIGVIFWLTLLPLTVQWVLKRHLLQEYVRRIRSSFFSFAKESLPIQSALCAS
jgi:hypothetical protein